MNLPKAISLDAAQRVQLQLERLVEALAPRCPSVASYAGSIRLAMCCA